MHPTAWTEPTLGYWQNIATAGALAVARVPPFRWGYPAPLPDGRFLVLPIRRLARDPARAVCSLIANQASFAVIDALCGHMAALAREAAPEVLVGLPTLGLAFAPDVARRLGHPHFVPLGYSRKFWYDDALSEPVQSITSPEPGKRLRLDPNLLPRLKGRRVLVVDDAVSTGATVTAALALLARAEADVCGVLVAMRQGAGWRGLPSPVRGVIDSPLLTLRDDGWWPST